VFGYRPDCRNHLSSLFLKKFRVHEILTEAPSEMSAGKFRHMPVVDQGRLVGMVSIGDVVKHRLHAMERDSAAMRDYIVTV